MFKIHYLNQIKSADAQSLKSQWIQCDDCSKWRKIDVDSSFPDVFTCSSEGQVSPYNTCDAEVEDGLPKSFEVDKDDSKEEVTLNLQYICIFN